MRPQSSKKERFRKRFRIDGIVIVFVCLSPPPTLSKHCPEHKVAFILIACRTVSTIVVAFFCSYNVDMLMWYVFSLEAHCEYSGFCVDMQRIHPLLDERASEKGAGMYVWERKRWQKHETRICISAYLYDKERWMYGAQWERWSELAYIIS